MVPQGFSLVVPQGLSLVVPQGVRRDGAARRRVVATAFVLTPKAL